MRCNHVVTGDRHVHIFRLPMGLRTSTVPGPDVMRGIHLQVAVV